MPKGKPRKTPTTTESGGTIPSSNEISSSSSLPGDGLPSHNTTTTTTSVQSTAFMTPQKKDDEGNNMTTTTADPQPPNTTDKNTADVAATTATVPTTLLLSQTTKSSNDDDNNDNKSDKNDKVVLVDHAEAETEEEAWELTKVFSSNEILGTNPTMCHNEGCPLKAAVLYTVVKSPDTYWCGCLDCQVCVADILSHPSTMIQHTEYLVVVVVVVDFVWYGTMFLTNFPPHFFCFVPLYTGNRIRWLAGW
jgi:hypothetical protein